MTAIAKQQTDDPRLDHFRPLAAGADWAAVAAAGLPTRQDEAWRYLKVNDLYGQPWSLARGVADTAKIPAFDGVTLLNGQPWAGLDALPAGITRPAANDAAPVLAGHGPALLNAALADALAFQVAAGEPRSLSLRFLTVSGSAAALSPARLVIEVAAGGQLDLYLDHEGGDAALTWSDTVVDLRLAKGAAARIVALARDAGRHTQVLAATLAAGARLNVADVVFGGRLTRRETQVAFTGPDALATLHAAYLGAASSHTDLFTHIHHDVPGCRSVQVFRGVLDDKASAAFQGRIVVARDAQKTDAHQSNRSLLLSRSAEANAKPELEIHADDVKCSHGATVGELDPTMLFYLMARGIPQEKARAMLVDAFIGEVLDAIPDVARAEGVRDDVAQWMAGRGHAT